MARADGGQYPTETRRVNHMPELSLEHDSIAVAEAAPPGSRGGEEAPREEVPGGGGDLRGVVDVGSVGEEVLPKVRGGREKLRLPRRRPRSRGSRDRGAIGGSVVEVITEESR